MHTSIKSLSSGNVEVQTSAALTLPKRELPLYGADSGTPAFLSIAIKDEIFELCIGNISAAEKLTRMLEIAHDLGHFMSVMEYTLLLNRMAQAAPENLGINPELSGKLFEFAQELRGRLCEFDVRGLATVARTFEVLQFPVPHLFDELSRQALRRIEFFPSREMYTLCHAYVHLGHDDFRLFNMFADHSMRKIDEFSPADLAGMSHLFSKVLGDDSDLFDVLTDAAAARISQLSYDSLCGFADSAYGAVDHSGKILEIVLPEVLARPELQQPALLSTLIHLEALGQRRDAQLAVIVSDSVRENPAKYKAFELGKIAYAFAKVGYNDQALFKAMAAELSPHFAELSEERLGMIAWAFAKSGHTDPDFYSAVAETARPNLLIMTPRTQVLLAWACVAGGYKNINFFKSIADALQLRCSELTEKGIANLAWVLANVDCCSHPLVSSLAREAQARMDEFTPQHLSMLVGAMARMNYRNNDLFEAAWQSAQNKLETYNTYDMASLLNAFAKINLGTVEFYDTVSKCIARRVAECTGPDLCAALWSLAVARRNTAEAVPILLEHALHIPREALSDKGSILIWSAAVLADEAIFVEIWERLLPVWEQQELSDQNLSQIHHAALFRGNLVELSPLLRERIDALAERRDRFTRVQSEFECEVTSVLQGFNMQPVVQHQCAGYFIDLALTISDTNWAIECDLDQLTRLGGKAQGRLLGASVMKEKILNDAGFKVLRIPLTWWRSLSSPASWLAQELGLKSCELAP